MKQKKIYIIIAGIVLAACIWWAWSYLSAPPVLTLVDQEKRLHGACPGETQKIEMVDDELPKTLPKGKKADLLPNWYACHPVEKGDLVYLRFSSQLPPVVRRVVAVPGNHFRLEKNKNKAEGEWNVLVEDETVTDMSERPHSFGSSITHLGAYEKSSKGLLAPKNYLIFSERSPGNFDSGDLGVVNSDDFLGKVELNEK